MARFVYGWTLSSHRLPTVSGWYPASLNCREGKLRWFDAASRTWSEYAPAALANGGTAAETCSPKSAALRAAKPCVKWPTGRICWKPQPETWPKQAQAKHYAEFYEGF